jgi:ribose transport system substrate-binding protein
MGRILTAIIAAAATVLAGGAALAQEKGLVAFSQADMANEWRVMNTREMQKAFEDAGYEFAWTNANADPAKQLADIEALLARKPVLLVVAPIEYEPLAPVPDKAAEANVPLLVVDRALPGEPGTKTWIALVTIDFVDTGQRVAEAVVRDMTAKNGAPKGRILHVTGNTGASPVIDEAKGIGNVLANHPDIEIVAKCDGLYSREPGRKCVEDFLQTFAEGTVDGVIFDNDDMMIGGIQAIKAAGRNELLGYLYGKDGTVDGLTTLLAGEAFFTVQTPPFFGAKSVEVFEKHKAGENIGELTQYVEKESFDNDTLEQRARLEERIKELRELGVGCC